VALYTVHTYVFFITGHAIQGNTTTTLKDTLHTIALATITLIIAVGIGIGIADVMLCRKYINNQFFHKVIYFVSMHVDTIEELTLPIDEQEHTDQQAAVAQVTQARLDTVDVSHHSY